MKTSPSPIKHPTDRYAWVWLILGAALLPFSSIQPSLRLAAWLAPVFLLRFVRMQRARVGLPLLAVVQAVAFGINWYIGTAPASFFAISGMVVGLLYTLGYAAD